MEMVPRVRISGTQAQNSTQKLNKYCSRRSNINDVSKEHAHRLLYFERELLDFPAPWSTLDDILPRIQYTLGTDTEVLGHNYSALGGA